MTYPQLQATSLQIPSGLRQVRPVLQTVRWPSQRAPRQPMQAPDFGELVGEVGLTLESTVGHDAPGAAYFVFTFPVSSQVTGSITLFLSPLGLLCMWENASIMMSIDNGLC